MRKFIPSAELAREMLVGFLIGKSFNALIADDYQHSIAASLLALALCYWMTSLVSEGRDEELAAPSGKEGAL